MTCEDVILLTSGRLCACVSCALKISVSISNRLSTYRYNSLEHKVFEVLSKFSEYKGVLRPKHLRTTGLQGPLGDAND